MNQESQKLEVILRNTLEHKTEVPSHGLLLKLKQRLWLSDFFSTNFSKFNVFYTAAIVAGISTASFLLQGTADEPASMIDLVTSVPEKSLEENNGPVSGEATNNDNSSIIVASNDLKEIRSENSMSGSMLTAVFFAEASRGCVPVEVKFHDQSINAVSWRWDFGTGDFSEKQNPVYTYRKPGRYQVMLTVKDDFGNKDVYLDEIEIYKRPVASLDIDRDNSEIASRKVIFKNNSEGATSYSWDFGDNKSSDAPQPVHVYNDFDEYRVTLIARSVNGCSDTAEITNKFLIRNYELAFPVSFKPNPFERNNNGFYEIAENEPYTYYPTNFGAKEYNLTIYTSNGIKVFETNNIKQGWNGYFGGSVAPGGYYNYAAKGTYPNGKRFEIKGKFKVIIDDYYYKF